MTVETNRGPPTHSSNSGPTHGRCDYCGTTKTHLVKDVAGKWQCLDGCPESVAAPMPGGVDDRTTYDAIEALNWSRLKLIERSPAHFKLGYGDDSAAFGLGTAVHMAILEPERFAKEYEVTSIRRDGRTAKWQEAETDAVRRGVTLMIKSEWDKTIAMRDSVRGNKRADALLSGGQPEVALTWNLGPFACKGRLDYRKPGAVIDLKSTQSASPKAFGYSVRKYGYLGQAAWYRDGEFLNSGEEKEFFFVAVESAPPYLVTVFRATDAQLAEGRNTYQDLLVKLDHCQRTGFWGGYSELDQVDLELPPRQQTQSEE